MITSSTWYITLSENKFQLKDFKPVAVLAESPMYLMVHKSSKLTCEKMKTTGTNYFVGSGAKGQTSVVANFLTKEFNHITEIPYKGVKQSVLDLLGNQIHGAIIASTTDLQEPLMLLANSSKYTMNGVPSFKELTDLNDDERNYLYNVSKKAEILDKLSIPSPSKDQEDKDIHDFQVMKGEILSGNDNKELIKKSDNVYITKLIITLDLKFERK
jgi:hypothetical protein